MKYLQNKMTSNYYITLTFTDFIDYGIVPRKPTDYETAKAAEALTEILKTLPPKPQLTKSTHTEDVTEKYIIKQYPIPTYSNYHKLSPLDLYKQINLKDNPISYDYNDYKYKNYHQQNSHNFNSNHYLAALVVDQNKNQIKPKPYFYNPPEVRRKYSGNQIRDVSKFNEEFRI